MFEVENIINSITTFYVVQLVCYADFSVGRCKTIMARY